MDITYKRYVFLDVDGVLNHPSYYVRLREEYTPEALLQMEELARNCDSNKLQLLNQLEGCEVVMITSWDHGHCQQVLPKLGLKLPIIGGVKARELQKRWLVRGNSIAEWFVDNYGDMPLDSFINSFKGDGWWHPCALFPIADREPGMQLDDTVAVSYVIFDDSADMLMDQKNHFIKVNPQTGLTQRDVTKAKKILNIKKDLN